MLEATSAQGVTDDGAPKAPGAKVVAPKPPRASTGAVRPPLSPVAQDALRALGRCSRTLLLCDFDKTLTDYDAGDCHPFFSRTDLISLGQMPHKNVLMSDHRVICFSSGEFGRQSCPVHAKQSGEKHQSEHCMCCS